MSKNKQTAVEWLIDQVEDFLGLLPVDLIQQAKAMEKQQQTDNYVNGMYKGQEIYFGEHKIKLDVNHLEYSVKLAEQYFKETYGSTK